MGIWFKVQVRYLPAAHQSASHLFLYRSIIVSRWSGCYSLAMYLTSFLSRINRPRMERNSRLLTPGSSIKTHGSCLVWTLPTRSGFTELRIGIQTAQVGPFGVVDRRCLLWRTMCESFACMYICRKSTDLSSCLPF